MINLIKLKCYQTDSKNLQTGKTKNETESAVRKNQFLIENQYKVNQFFIKELLPQLALRLWHCLSYTRSVEHTSKNNKTLFKYLITAPIAI